MICIIRLYGRSEVELGHKIKASPHGEPALILILIFL